ncbi:MAG: carboxypeptidase M32 [Planctomycetaceae bacterium]|nr:carboxypeptidase M32 [Planctomycetaceae bacterium]
MSEPDAPAYTELIGHLQESALLASCSHLLGWDEQTYLPAQGAEHRAEQMALLAGLVHERTVSPRIGELLSELDRIDLGAETAAAANVREARRSYERATRLPKELVVELSRVTTLSQQAWVEARQAKDFKKFEPWLEKVIALKREEATAVGYGDGVPYDALLDDYEPGMTAEKVQAAFTPLRDDLVSLVQQIAGSSVTPDRSIVTRAYSIDAQRAFGRRAAEAIGFDFSAGRLDEAAHPFCSGIGPGDCRLTTRYDEHFFPQALFGTLHEAGHGLYEQGLNRDAFGTAMGHSASLGIHESQSRMWENFVGRRRAFWEHFLTPFRETFSTALGDVSLDEFYAAINIVEPSFIRVEADEVTYNLHIMLRFELEQLLISGDLSAADVPAAWNQKFEEFFSLSPPDDSVGCMQDVHWSAGLIGYFPTYALGNMYAAQFFNAAQSELGDLHQQFSRGEFAPLKDWLRTNIHQRGHLYQADRLLEVVTSETLSHEPLTDHLTSKFGELYNLG